MAAQYGGVDVIRVIVVDDHPLVRAGLAAMIGSTDDLSVVADTGDGALVADLVARHEPHVVLMDLSMPGIDGVESTKRLLAARPGTPVVVLTSFHDGDRVRQALRAGAVGYLLKDSTPEDVVAAIRSAAAGDAPLDPRVAKALLPAATDDTGPVLSAREEQVLRLITAGLSNKQIGARLGIAERTVKVHVGHVFRQLGLADRTSAAMWARDNLPPAAPGAEY